MKKIYSKVISEKLLHVIVNKDDFKSGRQDVIDDSQFIQCSMLQMEAGKTFRPHKHIWKERTRNVIAQESWVIIRGSVEAILYDLDDTILEKVVLKEGDASFTLEGGHNYRILEQDTLVYEYKTGPYEGQLFDKEFIGGIDGIY
jgi:cupin fold WbuC family metalloprotein